MKVDMLKRSSSLPLQANYFFPVTKRKNETLLELKTGSLFTKLNKPLQHIGFSESILKQPLEREIDRTKL